MNRDEQFGATARQFFASRRTVFLCFSPADNVYRATVVVEGGPAQHYEADCPLLLLQAVLGTMRKKVCTVCQVPKFLTSFARAGESEEARAPACLGCEREGSRERRDRRTRRPSAPAD